MKCIDNELIQKYIDGEVSCREAEYIQSHIKTCNKCACRIEAQRAFAGELKKHIGFSAVQVVDIPEFVRPPMRKRRLSVKMKYSIYAASVACILALFFFIIPKKSNEEDLRLIYFFEGGFDANKPVSQQEVMLLIIDSGDRIIECN